jgi:hypothetical protein
MSEPEDAPISSVARSTINWNKTTGSLCSFNALLISNIAVSFRAFLSRCPISAAFSRAIAAKFARTERSLRSPSCRSLPSSGVAAAMIPIAAVGLFTGAASNPFTSRRRISRRRARSVPDLPSETIIPSREERTGFTTIL